MKGFFEKPRTIHVVNLILHSFTSVAYPERFEFRFRISIYPKGRPRLFLLICKFFLGNRYVTKDEPEHFKVKNCKSYTDFPVKRSYPDRKRIRIRNDYSGPDWPKGSRYNRVRIPQYCFIPPPPASH